MASQQYQEALACAKAAWQDGEAPPQITAVAEVTGLDPDRLWDHVEGECGWEPHDEGYEEQVWDCARQMGWSDGD